MADRQLLIHPYMHLQPPLSAGSEICRNTLSDSRTQCYFIRALWPWPLTFDFVIAYLTF